MDVSKLLFLRFRNRGLHLILGEFGLIDQSTLHTSLASTQADNILQPSNSCLPVSLKLSSLDRFNWFPIFQFPSSLSTNLHHSPPTFHPFSPPSLPSFPFTTNGPNPPHKNTKMPEPTNKSQKRPKAKRFGLLPNLPLKAFPGKVLVRKPTVSANAHRYLAYRLPSPLLS